MGNLYTQWQPSRYGTKSFTRNINGVVTCEVAYYNGRENDHYTTGWVAFVTTGGYNERLTDGSFSTKEEAQVVAEKLALTVLNDAVKVLNS